MKKLYKTDASNIHNCLNSISILTNTIERPRQIKTLKMKLSFIPLFLLSLFFFINPANSASLNVGTKVIYPGGAGQPPKEKDSGTSLNFDAKGASLNYKQRQNLNELLENEDFETLLRTARLILTREAKIYEAIALFKLGQKKKGIKLGKKLLKDKKLPEYLREKLCEELSLRVTED
jgi:hypothetical protein